MTQHLLLAWTVLLLIGTAVAYSVTRTALTRQFDDALRAKATALAGHVEEDNGRVELELSSQFTGPFDTDGSVFFQICRMDGRVLARSSSLREETIPFKDGGERGTRFWNLTLGSGLASRAIAMTFQPRHAHESSEGHEEAERKGTKSQRRHANELHDKAGVSDLIAVLASDRGKLDAALSTLAMVLGGSGLLVLALTAVAVPALLRLEMAPLDHLTNQAQSITAESLNVRFPTVGLPGELVPIATRLNGLLQRLQVSFERERQFSDDLAHELRTPIAEIRSLAELALKWPDGRSEETDRSVLGVALQMEKMVCRLLMMARNDGGSLPLAAAPVKLASFIAAVCDSYRAKALERNLTLDVQIPLVSEIQSDPVALQSIVSNLVENAVAYSRDGGVIQIRCELHSDNFALSVTNPVQRLDSEDVQHLFERFWRKDSARTGGEHAGLGLPLARSLAAALGYTLSAQLQEDRRLAMLLDGPLKVAQQLQAHTIQDDDAGKTTNENQSGADAYASTSAESAPLVLQGSLPTDN
jgi:two-component system sensor histidine kinase QseC